MRDANLGLRLVRVEGKLYQPKGLYPGGVECRLLGINSFTSRLKIERLVRMNAYKKYFNIMYNS